MAKKQPEPVVPPQPAPRSMDMVRRPAGAPLAPQARPVAPAPRPEPPRPQPVAERPVTPVRPQPAAPATPFRPVDPQAAPPVAPKPRRRAGRILLQIFAWLFVIIAVAAAVIELYIHYYQ